MDKAMNSSINATFQDVLEDPRNFMDVEVNLSGKLLVRNDQDCLFCDSGHGLECCFVFEKPSELYHLLVNNVPAYLGGRYLYDDDDEIRGVLSLTNQSTSQILWKSITYIHIRRDDEVYKLSAGGRGGA